MLADHVGREQEIEALACLACLGRKPAVAACGACKGTGRRKWKLARWSRAVWREMLEWARPQLPDPLDVARRMMLAMPAEHHAGVLAAALQMGCEPLHIGSESVQVLVNSMEGNAKLLSLLLKPAHPEASEDLAWDIILDIGMERLAGIKQRAEGKPPPPEADAGNPSAPA